MTTQTHKCTCGGEIGPRKQENGMLCDSDKMPFGKHKGIPMSDVPASYLHYLWWNGLKDDKRSDVADYIRRNLNAIKMESRDLIW